MAYVIDPPSLASLAVLGSEDRFPVHRIYCVGRNYAAHAVEMGHDPDREAPFFFQKNPDNLIPGGGEFPYPTHSNDVHHEIELVVALGIGGHHIPVDAAFEHIYGYAVGLDMTCRDLQGEMKKAGRPWEIGKAFDHSAPCSHVVPVGVCGYLHQGAIWLDVNGERRQSGDLNQLIWKVPEVISTLSQSFTLAPGDLIFTGTPSGVSAVNSGDVLLGGVTGLGELKVRVV